MEELTSLQKLEKAISEKDYISAKSYVVTAMRFDPRFENGTSDRMLSVLEERASDIFEDEKKLSYEERVLDSSKWDERYYMQVLVWFERNFAKTRLTHIKDVGRKVYPAKPTAPKAVPTRSQEPRPTQAPKSKKLLSQNLLLIVGAVAAVVAAVLLIIKLFK